MHQSVLAQWHAFSTDLEGRVHSMYLDLKALITTGVGNLIDSVPEAQKLPWKHADGSLATKEEVAGAWRALKARPDLARLHWKYAAKLNDLRLSDEDIDSLVARKLVEFEAHLKKSLPDFDGYPADAQLAIMSMAWAVGPGFTKTFKNFTAFALKQEWVNAGACSTIKTAGNPGVSPRNKRNLVCLRNAASVLELGSDIGELHWPNDLSAPAPGGKLGKQLAGSLPMPSALKAVFARPEITPADRARVAALQAQYARQVAEEVHVNGMRELAGLNTQPPADGLGDA